MMPAVHQGVHRTTTEQWQQEEHYLGVEMREDYIRAFEAWTHLAADVRTSWRRFVRAVDGADPAAEGQGRAGTAEQVHVLVTFERVWFSSGSQKKQMKKMDLNLPPLASCVIGLFSVFSRDLPDKSEPFFFFTRRFVQRIRSR